MIDLFSLPVHCQHQHSIAAAVPKKSPHFATNILPHANNVKPCLHFSIATRVEWQHLAAHRTIQTRKAAIFVRLEGCGEIPRNILHKREISVLANNGVLCLGLGKKKVNGNCSLEVEIVHCEARIDQSMTDSSLIKIHGRHKIWECPDTRQQSRNEW